MYTVITDGGHKKGIAYGSYKIYNDAGILLVHKQLVYDDETSNEAEYLTLVYAMQACLEHGFLEIAILTDSQLMAEQVLGNYACNALHLMRLRDKIRNMIYNTSFTSVSIKHVPRNIIKYHLGH